MVLVIMILTISLIILLLINVIPCIYINLLLSLIILYNTVYHYVYDSNNGRLLPYKYPYIMHTKLHVSRLKLFIVFKKNAMVK